MFAVCDISGTYRSKCDNFICRLFRKEIRKRFSDGDEFAFCDECESNLTWILFEADFLA